MPASLFVVSTPIGNLDDITLRAINTLKTVGLIAAEDTRRTTILLRHFGIATPTTSLHAHNEWQKVPQLLQKLVDGTDIAIVSDAGTPLVADPGQRLIAAAAEKGIPVVPIPGASAVLAALTVSGLGADQFVFAGFAPSRSNDRDKWLRRLAPEARPIVFFEAPHRIQKTLAALPEILGERPLVLCRELTKIHEEVVRTNTMLAGALKIMAKGEFTVVIGALQAPAANGVTDQVIDDAQIAAYFRHMTNKEGGDRRSAVARTAQFFGLSTNLVYRTLEKVKGQGLP